MFLFGFWRVPSSSRTPAQRRKLSSDEAVAHSPIGQPCACASPPPPPLRSLAAGTRSVRLLPGSIRPQVRRVSSTALWSASWLRCPRLPPAVKVDRRTAETQHALWADGVAHTRVGSSAPFWCCEPHSLTATATAARNKAIALSCSSSWFSLAFACIHELFSRSSSLESKWSSLDQRARWTPSSVSPSVLVSGSSTTSNWRKGSGSFSWMV